MTRPERREGPFPPVEPGVPSTPRRRRPAVLSAPRHILENSVYQVTDTSLAITHFPTIIKQTHAVVGASEEHKIPFRPWPLSEPGTS